MTRTLFASALLALALIAGPVAAQSLPPAPACPDPTEPSPVDPSLQAALDLVNSYRQQAGVPPVTLEPRLTQAAQAHSDDMAARGYFSHTTPEGVSPGTRITRAGYQWRTYGENIAMGYASWQAAIRGWMGSAGHRRNMLNPQFTHMGLGVASRRYTQVFASPR